jgi:hypothetical protein
MSFICEEIIDHAKGVVIAKEPKDLVHIRDADCAAAVWHRQFQPEFRQWINDLPAQNLPEGRLVLPKERVSDAVRQLCEMAEMPADPNRDLFINDVDSLSQLFAAVVETQYLRVRIEKVSDNACRKFHRDAVPARLVCTYRGRGTEYGTSIDGGDPEQIYSASTGAPILLRGSEWPEYPSSNLLHRSPPIEGTGETRLLLVLDPIFDPDNEF